MQAADVFLETERKDYRKSGPEERRRAVDLYSATPMTTAQVVEHLGYPTRQCLERWLAADPQYAGHMAKPIIPLETKDQGDRSGAGRHGRVAAQKQERRPVRQAGDAAGSGHRRRRGPAPADRGAGTGERGDAGGGGGSQKKTRAPTYGACRTGRRRCRLPATSPTAASRPRCRTGNGPRTSPGIKVRDGKGISLAAGRLPRRQDRRMHGRVRPQRRASQQDARQGRGNAAGGSASLGAFRPRMPLPAARMAGAHGPLRPDTVDGREKVVPRTTPPRRGSSDA